MSTALGKQVTAFGDADARERSGDRWEVEELAQLGPKLTALIIDSAQKRMIAGDLSSALAEEFAKVCGAMLASMSRARPTIAARSGSTSEFDGAMLELRELWARLVDHQSPDVKSAQSPTLEQFRQAAKDNPPKQSWFEEDLTGLRGPGR
jgi:hypothetical protein